MYENSFFLWFYGFEWFIWWNNEEGVLDTNLRYGGKKRFVLLSVFVCGSDVLLGFLLRDGLIREWNFGKMRGILCVGSNLSLYEGMIIIARAFLYTTLPFYFYFYYLSWLLALHFSFEYYQHRFSIVQIIKRQLLFHLLTISNIYL